MKKHITIFATTFFLISACAPATALPTQPPTKTPIPPTATPQPTVTPDPTPTSSLTPTLEPWMQNLPDSVVTVEKEGGVIFGVDADGERVMEFNLETDHWVELVSYNITRIASREREMSRVEWVQREDGSWGLPVEFLEWERERMLPSKLTDEQAAGINYLDAWWYSDRSLEIAFINPDEVKGTDIVQLFSVYKATLEPWGLAEEGYLITFQNTNADNSQSLVHFLLAPESYERFTGEGIYEKKGKLIPSVVIGPSAQSRMYPEGDKYKELIENFYLVQLGTTSKTEAKKHMVALAAQIGKSDSFAGEPEELIWSGDWIPEW